MKTMILATMAAGALVLINAGCMTTESDKATAIGAGIGAGLGAVLGNQLGGTSGNDRAWGAAAGALVGGAAGRMWGRQTETQNQVNYLQQQQFMTTVWIQNSNGSKTPVQLRQTEGGQYVGPRGEYYEKMPSQEQLKQIYGM